MTRRQMGFVGDMDTLMRQSPAQIGQRSLLAFLDFDIFATNRSKLLRGGLSIDRGFADPAAHLCFQPGDADHHEFVEVGPRNRQEPQPFEQGITGIARFRQHTAVEGQPA